MKICCKCKFPKSFDDFYKNKSCKDGFHKQCKSCHTIKRQSKEYNREYKLLSRYELTQEKFNIIFEFQDRRCAICRTSIPSKRGWVIDHDHLTGEVRGILCHKCNLGIGLLLDNINVVYKAYDYLRIQSPDIKYNMDRAG